MDKRSFLKSMAALAASTALPLKSLALRAPSSDKDLPWAISVDVLESCSCPPFCQCFFTSKPPASMEMGAGHEMGSKHVCRFIQAYHVNRGHSGDVVLDGVRFWFAGDAGDDFDKPKLDWAVFTFDSSMSQQQKDALMSVLRHLRWYRPERWNSYAVGPSESIQWSADEKGAHATLGTQSEVKLTTATGLQDKPVIMMNMDYFGYPRNNGFTLMPSDILTYRQGPHPFEYIAKGTNGLHTTLEMNAKDFPG